MKEHKYDLILLQDVHWDKRTLDLVIDEWGYKLVCSPFTTNSRGTAILFNNTFEFQLGTCKQDPNGNFTLAEITLHTDIAIVIRSIYGPNQDDPQFIQTLTEVIEEFDNPNILLGGDWNCTRSHQLDNINYIAQNNKKMVLAIDTMCNKLSLVDPWRINHPTQKRFTWLQGLSNKQARLDYYLCNEELMSITKNFDIKTKYRSDHAPITCTMVLGTKNRGPGIWKLNNSLLKDTEFIKMVKTEIKVFKSIYAATPYNPDYVGSISHGLELMISPTLFWETLLVILRGAIIRYSKRKKKHRDQMTIQLESRIKALDQKVSLGTASKEELIRLGELNSDLIEGRKENLRGAYVHSRADWLEFGEKPNKYFLNLENRNRINKNISEIKLEDETTITNQQDILIKVKEFYESLYQKQNPQILENALENPELTPEILTPREKELLEEPITKSELDLALKNMKNNKSPGLDGYSPEFFKMFLPQLGNYFLDCINYCFKHNHLTTSQTQGLITCLPKSGKARNLLKNWRPISLLNTSYKIISSCITNRLRPILCRIISPEQKGFLENRSIADCTRLMYDVIFECQIKEINGIILLIDFEKAFDSLSWDYIRECLTNLNFGENFIKWVSLFQLDSNSRIILNGHLSAPFFLKRGCRQGDPISPF